jgi:hypothetical protein
MEGWLYKSALPMMHITVNSQQPVAQKELQACPTRDTGFGKVACMLGQKVANMFGSENKEHWPFPNVNGCHRSIMTL